VKRNIFLYASLICSLVLITACSKQPLSLSGNFKQTNDWKGCGSAGKSTATIKIDQQGDSISVTNLNNDAVFKGTLKGNVISFKGGTFPIAQDGSNMILQDWQIAVSEDRNSTKGTTNWTLVNYGCKGVSLITNVRTSVQKSDKKTSPKLEDVVNTYSLRQVQPEEIGFSSQKLDELGAFIKKGVDQEIIPGAVVLIARHKKIGYFKSFGMRDIAVNSPMKRNTIFRIYSMTKPIVSVVALMLMEEGRISLDDPVSKYIPELGGLKVGVKSSNGEFQTVTSQRDMTILDLLRHTSGLTYGVFFKSEVKSLYKKAGVQSQNQTLSEMITKLSKIPLAYQPGTRWEYSRSTEVLGRLIEVVSGKTLDIILEERIFKPLKMVDTGFYVKPENLNRLAEPNNYLNVTVRPKLLSGGGGLTSTAGDYVRFAQMLLNGGELEGTRILKKETVELMTKDHLGTLGNRPDIQYFPGEASGFGLGVAVVTKQIGGSQPGSYFWMGWAGTIFVVNPETKVISILMFQNPSRLGYYAKKFLPLVRKSRVD
jgi:CubicO group peptidase (beta-lactamase class C family)